MILAGGPVFAFAKPVPVYLNNLGHPRRDEVLVSLAGPASNIVLACLSALALRAVPSIALTEPVGIDIVNALVDFGFTSISVNLSLAFFNLIPLPPLDGSSIIQPFLKGRALQAYYDVQRYSMPILIAVLYLLPTVLHIDLLGMYFSVTVDPMYLALARFALGI